MFVRWFYLHGFASGVWGSFSEPTPKNEAHNFSSPHTFVASIQLTVFTSSWLLANSLKTSCLFPSTLCRWYEHSFLLVPHLRRRPGTLFFIYLQEPWPKSLGNQLPAPVDSMSAISSFPLSLYFPINKPFVHFITVISPYIGRTENCISKVIPYARTKIIQFYLNHSVLGGTRYFWVCEVCKTNLFKSFGHFTRRWFC